MTVGTTTTSLLVCLTQHSTLRVRSTKYGYTRRGNNERNTSERGKRENKVNRKNSFNKLK